jgi:hypothetical protein
MFLPARSVPVLLLVLAGAAAVTVACGDDKGSDSEPQVCKDISSVCHDEDGGSGMATECHEQAEAGDATQCQMIHDECIAFCTGGTGSETGATMTMSTATVSDSGSTHAEETTQGDDTTAAHDGSTGDHGSTGADHGTGSETGANACDELGSSCHDIETPEAQACHEIGHAGELPACEEAYEMCAKICGL